MPDKATREVVDQIRALGYAVSIHSTDERVEARALVQIEPIDRFATTVAGNGPEPTYRCVCQLAEMMGIAAHAPR